MEAIFGVIEDLIERFKGSDPKDREEAKHELKTNFASGDFYLIKLDQPIHPMDMSLYTTTIFKLFHQIAQSTRRKSSAISTINKNNFKS